MSEKELRKRTLTNLYNQRPTWLDLAHKRLDEAVLDAYGWPHDLGATKRRWNGFWSPSPRAAPHLTPGPFPTREGEYAPSPALATPQACPL